MKTVKKIVRIASLGGGGLALTVLPRALFTKNGLTLAGGALIVGILSVVGYAWAESENPD